MIDGFEIVDGKLFIDKDLFRQAQLTDNNISKLTGSRCTHMFSSLPVIHTGIESVTIDYHNADYVSIPKELSKFVNELKDNYHYKVRGAIKVAINQEIFDVVINNY